MNQERARQPCEVPPRAIEWPSCYLVTREFCYRLLVWLLGKRDRTKARKLTEAQERIAQLEEEKNKWQLLERFTPRITVRGTQTNGQFITVTDSVSFRVIEMDYLTANWRNGH